MGPIKYLLLVLGRRFFAEFPQLRTEENPIIEIDTPEIALRLFCAGKSRPAKLLPIGGVTE
jgi:hypothetical protein